MCSRSTSIALPYSPNGSTRLDAPDSHSRGEHSSSSDRGWRAESPASQSTHATYHARSASCGQAPGHSPGTNRASPSGTAGTLRRRQQQNAKKVASAPAR